MKKKPQTKRGGNLLNRAAFDIIGIISLLVSFTGFYFTITRNSEHRALTIICLTLLIISVLLLFKIYRESRNHRKVEERTLREKVILERLLEEMETNYISSNDASKAYEDYKKNLPGLLDLFRIIEEEDCDSELGLFKICTSLSELFMQLKGSDGIYSACIVKSLEPENYNDLSFQEFTEATKIHVFIRSNNSLKRYTRGDDKRVFMLSAYTSLMEVLDKYYQEKSLDFSFFCNNMLQTEFYDNPRITHNRTFVERLKKVTESSDGDIEQIKAFKDENWPLSYKSNIVYPILLPRSSSKDRIRAFISIDASHTGAFDNNIDIPILKSVAEFIAQNSKTLSPKITQKLDDS